jgi:SAM-dependent methyltransferase
VPVRRSHAAPLAPHAWLRWDVVSRVLPRERARVLEIGCGRGGFGTRIAARHDYTAVEPDRASWAVASERVHAVAPGARVLNVAVEGFDEPGTFDVVCAFEVLEHLEDDATALAHWVRRARPGGTVLLSAPAWPSRFGPWDELAGHYRRYDPAVLCARLEAAGLCDVRVVVFGAPLGFALEAVRNRVVRRTGGVVRGSCAQRGSASGRLLQPTAAWVGFATAVATMPFRLIQRAFPGRGTGLVAWGRRPEEET